jgi:hypothetical protein
VVVHEETLKDGEVLAFDLRTAEVNARLWEHEDIMGFVNSPGYSVLTTVSVAAIVAGELFAEMEQDDRIAEERRRRGPQQAGLFGAW